MSILNSSAVIVYVRKSDNKNPQQVDETDVVLRRCVPGSGVKWNNDASQPTKCDLVLSDGDTLEVPGGGLWLVDIPATELI